MILSQLLGALRRAGSAGPAPDERNAAVMAEAMAQATEAATPRSATPVEGTILTVARAAADAAVRRAPRTRAPGLATCFAAAAAAAREALARTPEQLERARATPASSTPAAAGCAWSSTPPRPSLTGRRPIAAPAAARHARRSRCRGRPPTCTADGPAYEVMYLLDADDDADPRRCARRSPPLGDSLVVVGGEGLWNVHVHVDDVGAAIEAGIEAGRPHRVRVTHFAEQVDAARARRTPSRAPAAGSSRSPPAPAWPSCSARPAPIVIEGGPGRRPVDRAAPRGDRRRPAPPRWWCCPTTPTRCAPPQIAARTAEEDHDVRVAVIPTEAQVQGLAALAVHEPGRTFDAGRRSR